MEIELAEIRDFLVAHPPFSVLPNEVADLLPEKIMIRYVRHGSDMLKDNHCFPGLYVIRRGAVEIRDNSDELQDKLAEGDIFLYLENKDKSVYAVCIEDSLIYYLKETDFLWLQSKSADFRQQFETSIQNRMRQAVELTRRAEMRATEITVAEMTDRKPVILDINSSIQHAACIMTEEQVSAILLIKEGELAGLLTDRDIRSRCVAEGMSTSLPVGTIMSTNLRTLNCNALLSEALLLMTRYQLNHLPLLEAGKPYGILTTSDIIRQFGTNPALIAIDISKANSVEALVRISRQLPELQLQLSLSGALAHHIGEVFSSVTDAITIRLLELAEDELGKAPVSYVWLAGGSQARNEQTAHSDQDNALIIGDDYCDEHQYYFKKLADFVCDGLNACGYVYCPGDAMANNEKWRKSLSAWKAVFSDWINQPQPEALMLSSIFFDLRPIYGDFALFELLQQHVLDMTSHNDFFISHMVANALTHQPPIGFFRHFVMEQDSRHKKTLDIKHRGVVPIVDIARVLVLDNGLTPVSTLERLAVANECHALSDEMYHNLSDAFEYIASLKIRHQAEQIRYGKKPDNYLSPDALSGLERNHLKDAFMVIKTMQQYLQSRYDTLLVR